MEAKRIKIFVDAHSFDKEYQGAQTFIRELYTQLIQDHPALDIYFGACDAANLCAAFPQLPVKNILPYKKRRIGYLRFVLDIPQLIKKHRFDYAHFQYIAPRRIAGCKYIVTLHDVLFNDFKQDFSRVFRLSRNLIFGNSIKRAHLKTTVSYYSKQRIGNSYNIAAEDIHILHNGVNYEFMQAEVSREEAIDTVRQQYGLENFILYTSRVEPRKNHLLLLQTYLKLGLDQQGIGLVFIGHESVKLPELTQLIGNLTDAQKALFRWIQQVDQNHLVSFYKACRLFVYPSKAEGFGIPPLEAAACHTPVLCSSGTAMQSFDFFEPYMFNPDDEREFERKLSNMINIAPSQEHIARVAAAIKTHYSWQQSSNIFYNLIQATTAYETEHSHTGHTRHPELLRWV